MNEDNRIRKFDTFMNYQLGKNKDSLRVVDLLFVFSVFILAIIVRIKLFPIESADYYGFLKVWMERIKEYGAFKSLSIEISNYSSPYMYLMSIASIFDNSLYALKTVSVIFDFSAAIAVYLIVKELTGNITKGILGMSFLLMCPAVLIDSAYWCQCDVIYSSFILWALYFFFKKNSRMCLIFIGIAFSFKLQTLFVIPFLIIMWLKEKNIKLLDFIYIPIVYVVSCVPAMIAGRPIKDLLFVYFNQSSYYPWGTLQYPNLYALLDETIESSHHMKEITGAGAFITVFILGVIAYYLYTKEFSVENEIVLLIMIFTVSIAVYTLPHMHDRYGFLIDVLMCIYATCNAKRIPLLCAVSLVSILTYMPYLIGVNIFSLRVVAVFQLTIIVYIGYRLYIVINENMIRKDK